ncbi:MAG: MFS transporter [Candidatus Binataceae bacterium]
MDAHNLESHGAPRTRWGRLFRHADFMKLWTGETVSLFGTRIGGVALSFAAVITLRATPFQIGLLAAAGNVPTLVFSLITGAWVDRLRRRPIMIFADLGRTAILATIPLAAVYGALTMRQLYVVMLLAALLDLFFDVAYRAYLPTLVAREDLLDANSKLTASAAVAEVAGFGLCGWLVQWLSAPFAILFDSISFLASAGAIAAIRAPEPALEARRREDGIAHEIADGVRTIWSDRRLRALGMTAVVGGFSYSLVTTLYMLFVVNALGFKPATLGMIFAVGGASSLFGALAAQRAAAAFGAGRAMAFGLAVEGFALMLLPIAHGAGIASIALLVAQQLIGDGASTICFINSVTLIQAITPHRMLGRVNASLRFVNLSAILAGELIAGIAGGVVGLRPTMVAGAAGLWITAALLAASEIGSVVSIGGSVAIAEPADRPA